MTEKDRRELEREIRRELEEESCAALEEARAEMERDLRDELERKIRDELVDGIRDELQEELRAGLADELRAEIAEEIRKESEEAQPELQKCQALIERLTAERAGIARDTLDGLKTREALTPEAYEAMREAVTEETDALLIRSADLAAAMLAQLQDLWEAAFRKAAAADTALIILRHMQDAKAPVWKRSGYDGSQRAQIMHDARLGFVSAMREVLASNTATAYVAHGKEAQHGD